MGDAEATVLLVVALALICIPCCAGMASTGERAGGKEQGRAEERCRIECDADDYDAIRVDGDNCYCEVGRG